MKIIIECDDDRVDEAVTILAAEMVNFRTRYDRVGWGWSFKLGDARCFVRRIKDGLSLKQRPAEPIVPPPLTGGGG